MENNQSASRAARRFLSDRVRKDWDWPNMPDCWSASDEEVRGISEFRERYYGSSSSDHEPESDTEDPYKFDSPDSIGDAVERKLQARKRRKRRLLEQEAQSNPGLANFVAQRDAWTGAAAVRKYGTQRPAKSAPTEEGDDTITANALAEPLIPVAPPLLQGNSIRSSITPKVYPDIYTKIVMSSRTPLVPINLADMTKALVQGWKDNGEWPPKAGPLDPLVGRKRALASVKMDHGDGQFLAHHPHVKKGMDSVKRILHLNGNGHGPEHGAVGNNG
ncbi:hypothetical protein K504DRAFT_382120 [Pleomassaria siparia CBS 279.74]|uniref:Gag1-like clamp domain-containing protein n=1 Tax=Pleomassaria siparia CBS 279.74 TaxID=1314801 RepID=A0A6G1K7U8_9PLEO|nr:hypothetical protein K504DRAFT_382120 [Pleomassaria siparia CBS 279.74]